MHEFKPGDVVKAGQPEWGSSYIYGLTSIERGPAWSKVEIEFDSNLLILDTGYTSPASGNPTVKVLYDTQVLYIVDGRQPDGQPNWCRVLT